MLTRSHIAVPEHKRKRSTDHLEMSPGRKYTKFADIVHRIIPTKRVLKKGNQTKITFPKILAFCFRQQILVSFKILRHCQWKNNKSLVVLWSFGLTELDKKNLKFLNQLQHAATCPLQWWILLTQIIEHNCSFGDIDAKAKLYNYNIIAARAVPAGYFDHEITAGRHSNDDKRYTIGMYFRSWKSE